MSFPAAHPLFLSLLPLALAPILFHLFFRIRRRAVAFSTFMFFHRIHPRLSERRKVKDWLVLLLRVLTLALLFLALAGLVWTSGGRGGRTAAVLVLDNSASMTRRAASGETLLDAARAAAAAVLGTLETGDSAALVATVRDPAAPDAGTLRRDLDRVAAALQAAPPTEAAGRPAEALRLALEQLAGAGTARREIHVFTDLQEHEWGTPPASAAADAGTALFIHRLAPAAPPPNVSLVSVRPPAQRLLAGRKIPLGARLRAGDQPAVVRLHWIDPAGRPGSLEARLAAGEEKVFPFSIAPQDPGAFAMAAWLDGDGFEADNRAAAVLPVQPRQTVLFLGSRPAFGLLPPALAPGGGGALSGLEPVFADPAAAAAALAESQPLLAVIPWDRLPPPGPALDALRGYVFAGGRLLVLPDAATEKEPAAIPDWIGARPGPAERPDPALPLIPLDPEAPFFDSLRDPDGTIRLRQVRVNRFRPLEAEAGAVALLGLEDGRPLLVMQKRDKGRVYAGGLALDGRWSTLPLKPAFLALAQQLALEGAAAAAPLRELRAGEPFPEAPAGERVRLRLEGAPPVDWQGEAARLPVPSRSGTWLLETGTNTQRFAVSAHPAEGRFAETAARPVPAALGLPHTVETVSSPGALAERIRRDRRGLRLFHPFLIACLLALLAEGWLANPRLGGP